MLTYTLLYFKEMQKLLYQSYQFFSSKCDHHILLYSSYSYSSSKVIIVAALLTIAQIYISSVLIFFIFSTRFFIRTIIITEVANINSTSSYTKKGPLQLLLINLKFKVRTFLRKSLSRQNFFMLGKSFLIQNCCQQL